MRKTRSVDRSSIELLGSASALDLFGDAARTAVVVGWFLVVVLVAGALVAAAWGRPSLVALVALPIGPAMALAWWAVAASPLIVRWGAPMGTLSGLTASVAGALVLMEQGSGGKEPTR